MLMTRQKSLAARGRFSADRRGLSHADDAGQYSGTQLKPSCTALDDSWGNLMGLHSPSTTERRRCWDRGALLSVPGVPDKHLNMFMHGREVFSGMSEPWLARSADSLSAVYSPSVP